MRTAADVRDPRKDPQPGDVLEFGPQWQRERVDVTARDGMFVRYQHQSGVGLRQSVEYWQRLMADAGVLHVSKG